MSHLRSPRVLAVLIAFLLAGAGLGLMLTIGLGSGTAAPATGPVTGSVPTFTTAGDRWTLDQVLRGARAGDVEAISAMTPAAGSGLSAPVPAPVLIVRTSTGAIYAIRPEVPIGDALDVIRAAGYARLLTDEAIALDTGPTAGGLPTLLGFAMSASVLVILVLMFVRLRGGSTRSWRPSGGVQGRRRTDQPVAGERPNVTLADVKVNGVSLGDIVQGLDVALLQRRQAGVDVPAVVVAVGDLRRRGHEGPPRPAPWRGSSARSWRG